MRAFQKLTGVAAPFPRMNVDTDMIIPKVFLKTISREGLGAGLFSELRFSPDGSEIDEFVLNQSPYRNARILVSYDNFGCGSSREHAAWALTDFGIHCVIATSFGDIFYNNCFQNGILPVTLHRSEVDQVMEHATISPKNQLSVDLEEQLVTGLTSGPLEFEIDDALRRPLLKGLDQIGLTLLNTDVICAFERKQQETMTWL